MHSLSVIFFVRKLFLLKKILKKCKKFDNFELWNSSKNPIFNFFQILFFLNHCWYAYFHFKKSNWQKNVSFYFIFEKPQKMRDIRGFLVNWANLHSFWNFDPKFGFSDQKRFRKVLQTLWNRTWPKFCCIVLWDSGAKCVFSWRKTTIF